MSRPPPRGSQPPGPGQRPPQQHHQQQHAQHPQPQQRRQQYRYKYRAEEVREAYLSDKESGLVRRWEGRGLVNETAEKEIVSRGVGGCRPRYVGPVSADTG
jgi:hypothetical protein